ncbi:MAG: YbaB/EbfC family nucleoid-associated protein [bacterium]|nr:YbaB/EbfC family nucleoid-associated protein [candidate division KSB1 bacterium]MDH7561421.1 YbaB/EbfC family nucleoid-associated protein [bacterium]
MGLGGLLKQAQKMQEQMQRAQEELAALRVEGTAGGGMVKAVVTGKYEVVEVKIDPEVVNPEDVEMLEDLVVAALNQAFQKVQERAAEEMSKVTGGLGSNLLPGLM